MSSAELIAAYRRAPHTAIVDAALTYSASAELLSVAPAAWHELEHAPAELMSGFERLMHEVSLYLSFIDEARR